MNTSAQTVRGFFQQLTAQQKHGYAFAEFNIKNFRYFCTRLGRQESDQLLEHIKQTAERSIQHKGIVERVYSDTFHMLVECPSCTPENANDTIRDSFLFQLTKDLYHIQDEHAHKQLYLSFGVIAPPDMDQPFETLVTKAGLARKSCPYLHSRAFSYELYNDQMLQTQLRKLDLEHRLTSARHNQEFDIYVQPKVDPRTQQIVAGEVLMRWNNAGSTPIGAYIDLLQEFSDIYVVDRSIFQNCCAYLSEGLKEGKPRVPLSFNISKATVGAQDFCEEYFSIVEQYQLDKSYIEFEFLENIHLTENPAAQEALKKCHDNGYRCSLDDFGMGNSSFAFLLNGGVDCIKLDRVFFTGTLTPQRQMLLQDLIHIAETFNVSIVAEGVEAEEYVEFLKTTSCHCIQGFYYYRPLPLADFQHLLDLQAQGHILPKLS